LTAPVGPGAGAPRRVLVVGSAGQDGSILVERLSAEGCALVGLDRGVAQSVGGAPDAVGVALGDRDAVRALVSRFAPDEIYYLAAHHHSSEEGPGADLAETFHAMTSVHVSWLVDVLEAVRQSAPRARVVYASSSHVFGEPSTSTQDESTPIAPTGIYGITKAAGMHACAFYRRRGVEASSVILYNHESPRRRGTFVSQRIVQGARRALENEHAGERFSLRLGRLDAVVDWGYAPDYVDAMLRVARLEPGRAGDFVVATGVPHTVRDFAAAAFSAVGLDWREYVEEDSSLLRQGLPVLVGDASKLRAATGWRPSVTFDEMVEILIRG